MIVHSMTATFGKLENQTLTLEPGLNILSRPNEWGKSTWCAFLIAMFYGVETKERTRKNALADKEHYAPWSGSPMSGRIDLTWEGRDITLERSTKGRIPMGQFRAYETRSGLEVKELTGENCGRVLLGLERGVFERTAFIRLSEMPVTQDEPLRRQLNALVTTGQDGSEGELLGSKLRDLQNACQSNRSRGKIPETAEKLEKVRSDLAKIRQIHTSLEELQEKNQQLTQQIRQLRDHLSQLDYEDSLAAKGRWEEARQRRNDLDAQLFVAQDALLHCPSQEELREKIAQLEELDRNLGLYQSQSAALGLPPQPPAPQAPLETVRLHAREYTALGSKTALPLWAAVLPAALAVGAVACCSIAPWAALLLAGIMAAVLALGLLQRSKTKGRKLLRQKELSALYGSDNPHLWVEKAENYVNQMAAYEDALARFTAQRQALTAQQEHLEALQRQLCPHTSVAQALKECRDSLQALADAQQLRQSLLQQDALVRQLEALVKEVEAPSSVTQLHLSRAETQHLLGQKEAALQDTLQRQSSCQGALSARESPQALAQQEKALQQRLEKLQLYFRALTLAQEKLALAKNELQRRFAPQISQEAARLFSRITQGRYNRLSLSDDLSLHTSAQEETSLHSVLWRSQGTADQLYLSLRLAMAQAMAPHAPLVLDDTLAHFDDQRAKEALEVLRELAQEKQILLLTCHSREA